jgi:hypothetical protein
VWELPFEGDVQAAPGGEYPIPPAEQLGLAVALKYEPLVAYEHDQPGYGPTTVSASYRWTDGAFLFVHIMGAHGIHYYFASTKPDKAEAPVAIEFRVK